jgi:TP901 family phage tail tape measure protein
MNKASTAAAQTAKATEKVGSSVDKTKSSMLTFKNIALYAFGYGATTAIVRGLRNVANTMMDFEDAMAELGAASMATSGELASMKQAALDAGQATSFTATEAAKAMTELSKAGVATADIIDGALAGALTLASAGQVDVAFAAETAATAMVQFNVAGSDMSYVADLLAAGAGKAQGGVEELALALRQGGQVASMVGWDFKDTTTALTAFAAAGLLGSDAGTSLKTMLLRLAAPTDKAREQMEALGLSVYDASGNMVGAPELAGRLTAAFADLTPEARNAAMSIIFGTDAVRAANVLYANGQRGIQRWADDVDDAGYAAEQAAKKTDTLRGDLNRLKGTFESLLNTPDDGTGILRESVQLLDEMLRLIGEINAEAPSPGTSWFEGGKTTGPQAYYGKAPALPFDLNNDMAWETGIVDILRARREQSEKGEEFSFDQLMAGSYGWEGYDELAKAQRQAASDTEYLIASARNLPEHLAAAERHADDAGEAFGIMGLDADDAADAIDILKDSILNLGGQFVSIEQAQDDLTRAIDNAKQPFRDLSDAQAELAEARDDLAKADSDAAKEAAQEAVARAEQGVAAAQAALTLKGNSEAAMDNRDRMRELRDQALDTATAFVNGTAAGAEKAREATERARGEFIKVADDMDYTAEEAAALADEYGLIPDDVYTEAVFLDDEAQARLSAYSALIDGIPPYVATRLAIIEDRVQRQDAARLTGLASQYGYWNADNVWVPNQADGGWVGGSGSGRSDNVLTNLTPGEFVVGAQAASAFGPLLQSMNALGTAVATMPGGINFTGDINVRDGRDLTSHARLQRLVYG